MNRFDLEQQLMGLLTISDDLDLVVKGVLEYDLDKDNIANVLTGISNLVKLRHYQLMDTMVQIFKLDKYDHS